VVMKEEVMLEGGGVCVRVCVVMNEEVMLEGGGGVCGGGISIPSSIPPDGLVRM
jgi:hypothetical protein